MKNIIKNHEKILINKIFFSNSKWPHFELLINDIKKISKKKEFKNILSLERGGLYGGISLFAPYFNKKKFISIDCSPKKILKRGAYNGKFVKDKKLIKIPLDKYNSYKNIRMKENSIDLIVIPNLLHHIFDFENLFKQCKKILKKNGSLYLFEPTLRELHQKPEDYFRFTPYGIEKCLQKLGFKISKTNLNGGPFSAAAYCLDQAKQYIPNNKIRKYDNMFNIKKLKDLIKMDKTYKRNLMRKNSSFPVSFSVLAKLK